MPFHHHRPPSWLRRAIIGLLALSAMNLVGLAASLYQDIQQQQYIEGRGEFRDREADRMEAEAQERLRIGICDLLDQLPEGGLLDRPRAKYGCGPGIPLEELTPGEQAEVGSRTRPAVPSQREPEQEAGSDPRTSTVPRRPATSPSAPSREPTPPPSQPSAAPAPAPVEPEQPPPLVDLDPLTDLLCDTRLLCT